MYKRLPVQVPRQAGKLWSGGEHERGLTHPLTDDTEGHFSNEPLFAAYDDPLPRVTGWGTNVLLVIFAQRDASYNKLEWVITDPLSVTLGSGV